MALYKYRIEYIYSPQINPRIEVLEDIFSDKIPSLEEIQEKINKKHNLDFVGEILSTYLLETIIEASDNTENIQKNKELFKNFNWGE